MRTKEQEFIKGLSAGLSVSVAMKQAGYSSRTDARRIILMNPRICSTVITMLLEGTDQPDETVIELFKERLIDIVQAKITDFVSFGPEGVKIRKNFPKEKAFCIAELQMKDSETVTYIRLHDGLKATELLLRYARLTL
ncbi:MAG: terminase small subunit [Nitrospirae bacterium]|nr:terminase small subunit [Nitrospirota bacterium]